MQGREKQKKPLTERKEYKGHRKSARIQNRQLVFTPSSLLLALSGEKTGEGSPSEYKVAPWAAPARFCELLKHWFSSRDGFNSWHCSFGCHSVVGWEGYATDTQWVEARDTGKRFQKRRTAPPQQRIIRRQISCSKAKKPCSKADRGRERTTLFATASLLTPNH